MDLEALAGSSPQIILSVFGAKIITSLVHLGADLTTRCSGREKVEEERGERVRRRV